MRQRRKKAAKTVSSGKGFTEKPNRELKAQTRKMLGRHYAAKYRVR